MLPQHQGVFRWALSRRTSCTSYDPAMVAPMVGTELNDLSLEAHRCPGFGAYLLPPEISPVETPMATSNSPSGNDRSVWIALLIVTCTRRALLEQRCEMYVRRAERVNTSSVRSCDTGYRWTLLFCGTRPRGLSYSWRSSAFEARGGMTAIQSAYFGHY